MSTIVTIAIAVLAVLIVGGIVTAFVVMWFVAGKQHDEQKAQNELPMVTIYGKELEYGIIKFTSSLSDSIGLFDPVKKVLQLVSEKEGSHSINVPDQESAESAFEEFVEDDVQEAYNDLGSD